MVVGAADPDPADRQLDAGHRAGERQPAGARGLEVDAIDRAVVDEPVGECQAVGAEPEQVATLEADRRRAHRGARHDPPAEHDSAGASVRDPQMPTRRVVPDVVTGRGAGVEERRHPLDGSGPATVLADGGRGGGRGGRGGRRVGGERRSGRDEQCAERQEAEQAGEERASGRHRVVSSAWSGWREPSGRAYDRRRSDVSGR